jgi:hypothetical protein
MRHEQSIKHDKRCLEHKLGRVFRESNHGYGEMATRDCAIAQGDDQTKMGDFGPCLVG